MPRTAGCPDVPLAQHDIVKSIVVEVRARDPNLRLLIGELHCPVEVAVPVTQQDTSQTDLVQPTVAVDVAVVPRSGRTPTRRNETESGAELPEDPAAPVRRHARPDLEVRETVLAEHEGRGTQGGKDQQGESWCPSYFRLRLQEMRAMRYCKAGRADRARSSLGKEVPFSSEVQGMPSSSSERILAEQVRLEEEARREKDWKRWGPYLPERQWGTVREDYSPDGESWTSFSHDEARSRAYRWGEDGLLGITDRKCRLCFALALWNGQDDILKERLFGLTGPDGNHGEDVKECYYYLDSTPTHSYMKALYKYPQSAFPYSLLLMENRRRGRNELEYEILDTGVFEGSRYFDVYVEYAKASPNDILIRITAWNRGERPSPLHVLPTLRFRNTWSSGRTGEGYTGKLAIRAASGDRLVADHPTLGRFHLAVGRGPDGSLPPLLFTENETNVERLFRARNPSPHVKDAFHEHVVHGNAGAVRDGGPGSKVAPHYRAEIPGGESLVLELRLIAEEEAPAEPFGEGFRQLFDQRIEEADAFHDARVPRELSEEKRRVVRQGHAGLLWTKQFYYYSVKEWIEGDPAQPPPPESRERGRNSDWKHLYNRDVISVPDKWEYPWYAAWDLAFHMIPFARIDPRFAKEQLVLFLREWYMHPNGQIPAYEFALGDVNPPVHAWAAWRVYKMTAPRGERDRVFLAQVFHKLLLNFTWWVNRKDLDGNHIFSGGFLGLDNIGVFDRSRPLPSGGRLEQADGTAWMAFYCATMLSIALELAEEDRSYEGVASKFFEHFVAIVDAMNSLGGTGLWDERDGFYYDHLHLDGRIIPLRARSLVGLVPLMTVEVLTQKSIDRLPGFRNRMRWFLENRADLARHITCMECSGGEDGPARYLLAVPSRERLLRILRYLLDENEFLSPHGVRSLSRVHRDSPYSFRAGDREYRVGYVSGESDSGMFGGNSNWRGPIWLPMNYLIIEALERYHHFYGDDLRVECPVGSGRSLNLREVAEEIARRVVRLFVPAGDGRRPCHGETGCFATDPHWRDLVLFPEYFDGDTGRGLGASHQTGWTALVINCLEKEARAVRRGGRSS